MQLDKVMTYTLTRMRGPLASTKGSPTGERQYWEMTEGHLRGHGIDARIAMPGGDWMNVGSDGFWRPDVRLQLETDDGAIILVHYTGLVEQTDRFQQAAERGEATEWADQYMRMVLQFETGAPRYAWLTQRIFIARGRLLGDQQIEYEVFAVR
jgi:hypothetical protein